MFEAKRWAYFEQNVTRRRQLQFRWSVDDHDLPTLQIRVIFCVRWRRCALQVSQGNARSATNYLAELRKRTSPYGDCMQRTGHYFLEALVSR
jgi:hypothetical protein